MQQGGAIELPPGPEFPSDLRFQLPPIPRLLPPRERLLSLNAQPWLAIAAPTQTQSQQLIALFREASTDDSVASDDGGASHVRLGAGAAVGGIGAGAAIALLRFRFSRRGARLTLRRQKSHAAARSESEVQR